MVHVENKDGRELVSAVQIFDYDEMEQYLSSVEAEYTKPEDNKDGDYEFMLELEFLSYHEANPGHSIDTSLEDIEGSMRGELTFTMYATEDGASPSLFRHTEKDISFSDARSFLEPMRQVKNKT